MKPYSKYREIGGLIPTHREMGGLISKYCIGELVGLIPKYRGYGRFNPSV